MSALCVNAEQRETLANDQVYMVGQFSVSAIRVQIGIQSVNSV